jgi:ATP-binding cassette, subfamily B, bacterial PglK
LKDSFLYKLTSVYKFIEEKDQSRFWMILFLMFIGMLFEIGGISILMPMMIVLLESDIGSQYPVVIPFLDLIGNPSKEKLIIFTLVAVFFYYVVKSTFLIFVARTQAKFTYHIKSTISQKLFNSYIYQDYIFHLNNNSSDLIRNITTEITHFTDGILKQILFLGVELVVIFGITVFLFYINPVTMLLVVLTLGLGSVAYYFFSKNKLVKWGSIRQINESARIKHLQQGIAGIKEVKISGKESNFTSAFEKHNLKINEVEGNQFFYTFLPRIILETLAVITLIILIFSLILQGDSVVNFVPMLAVFAAGAFRILPSTTRIMHAISQLRFEAPVLWLFIKEMESYNEINAKLKESSLGNDGGDFTHPIDFKKNIKIEHLSYSYSHSINSVLSDIDLEIKKGEVVGFIGESGAGKSTLINILLGLLQPSDGQVLCDNIDISNNIKAWQKNIGYVPQSVYLTDDSVVNNVAFGELDADIDFQRIEKAIEYAQLTDVVSALDSGLDTQLGERGVRLSGGQIQRIGIARALYSNPPILVFDEASSALDSETEKEIVKSIDSLGGNKTIIIIAHRISTLKNCDKIYTLKQGKIVAQNTYEELQKIIN